MKIKTLILGLLVTGALATATAASACHGNGARHNGRFHSARVNTSFVAFKGGMEHGFKFGFRAHRGTVAKLSGTGSDFSSTNPSASGSVAGGDNQSAGTFTLGLNTTWSSATTNTWNDNDGDADDGTVTVSCAPSTATLTLTGSSSSTSTLTGSACSLTRNGSTVYGFLGMSSDGSTKAFIKENGTAVTGVVFNRAAVENNVFAGLFAALRHSLKSSH